MIPLRLEEARMAEYAGYSFAFDALKSIGGLVLAIIGLATYIASTRQKRENRKQQSAMEALKMLDLATKNESVRNALMMLDWESRPYLSRDNQREVTITKDMVKAALQPSPDVDFSIAFVRDSFDALFEYLGSAYSYVEAEIIRWEDLEFLKYFTVILKEDLYRIYVFRYGYKRAWKFIEQMNTKDF
jgi:hypothetical protein